MYTRQSHGNLCVKHNVIQSYDVLMQLMIKHVLSLLSHRSGTKDGVHIEGSKVTPFESFKDGGFQVYLVAWGVSFRLQRWISWSWKHQEIIQWYWPQCECFVTYMYTYVYNRCCFMCLCSWLFQSVLQWVFDFSRACSLAVPTGHRIRRRAAWKKFQFGSNACGSLYLRHA